MTLLLIDDEPERRIEKIAEAVANTGYKMNIVYVKQNDETTIKPYLSDCNLVILDWYFPAGCPTGEETLNSIRRLGYQGPILIYTKGFGKFDKFIKAGKADDYYWESWGIGSLTGIIKRLSSVSFVTNRRDENVSTIENWIYYKNTNDMEQHFYHPLSTCSAGNGEEKEEAMDKVVLVTTEWNGTKATGNSMGKIIRDIELIADTDISVIILGETGTGKELIAKLLHYHHKNKGKRYGFKKSHTREWFMALNCGTFHKETLNVELFGSLPGAFTDAEDKAGIFEQVTDYDKDHNAQDGGTVFLDEIALMEVSSQAFLLRVFQENYLYRMGHNFEKAYSGTGRTVKTKTGEEIGRYKYGSIPVKFRLVAATNENLASMLKKGELRLDLFHRISRISIKLPPLRSRPPEDFNLLFQYFLHRYNEKHERSVELSHNNGVLTPPSSELIEYLWARFPWKGNVRELEGIIDSMVALSEKNRSTDLSIEDIPEFFRDMEM